MRLSLHSLYLSLYGLRLSLHSPRRGCHCTAWDVAVAGQPETDSCCTTRGCRFTAWDALASQHETVAAKPETRLSLHSLRRGCRCHSPHYASLPCTKFLTRLNSARCSLIDSCVWSLCSLQNKASYHLFTAMATFSILTQFAMIHFLHFTPL